MLGIGPDKAEARFGFLLKALRFGAPPAAGASPTASTAGSPSCTKRESIRDVIAFPKAASGADPLTGAPAPVDEEQLRELGIQLRRRG